MPHDLSEFNEKFRDVVSLIGEACSSVQWGPKTNSDLLICSYLAAFMERLNSVVLLNCDNKFRSSEIVIRNIIEMSVDLINTVKYGDLYIKILVLRLYKEKIGCLRSVVDFELCDNIELDCKDVERQIYEYKEKCCILKKELSGAEISKNLKHFNIKEAFRIAGFPKYYIYFKELSESAHPNVEGVLQDHLVINNYVSVYLSKIPNKKKIRLSTLICTDMVFDALLCFFDSKDLDKSKLVEAQRVRDEAIDLLVLK